MEPTAGYGDSGHPAVGSNNERKQMINGFRPVMVQNFPGWLCRFTLCGTGAARAGRGAEDSQTAVFQVFE